METESDITRFVLPSNMTLSQYVEKLVTNSLRCGDLYEEYAFNEMLIEGLSASIRIFIRDYWEKTNDVSLRDLAFHTTSIFWLQRHDVASKQTYLAGSKLKTNAGNCGRTTSQALTP